MMRAVAALVASVLAVGLLTACDSAPRSLDGVKVLVYQPRLDIAAGRLAIQVANGSDADLDVVGARLTSPGFREDAAWDGDGTTIGAGRTIDLRAPLPVVDCTVSGAAEVVLEYRDGTAIRTARVDPEDPYGFLDRLRTDQCLAERVAEVVAIVPREVRVVGPAEPATLVFEVTPTGAPGTVVLDAVDGTPLLQPAVDGIAVRDVLALGLALSAEGPREFAIPLVPNRCDAHALADDKVGTIIPFLVSVDGTAGARFPIATPEGLKGELTGYYALACGLAAP